MWKSTDRIFNGHAGWGILGMEVHTAKVRKHCYKSMVRSSIKARDPDDCKLWYSASVTELGEFRNIKE